MLWFRVQFQVWLGLSAFAVLSGGFGLVRLVVLV